MSMLKRLYIEVVFDLDIYFAEAVLSFESVSFGNWLGTPDADQTIDIEAPYETDIYVDDTVAGEVFDFYRVLSG